MLACFGLRLKKKKERKITLWNIQINKIFIFNEVTIVQKVILCDIKSQLRFLGFYYRKIKCEIKGILWDVKSQEKTKTVISNLIMRNKVAIIRKKRNIK